MRKSLWMLPIVLLITALGSTPAHADTVVASGGNVTAINGITIAGTTYNVTFGTTMDTTFAGNASNASAMNAAILFDLNSTGTYLTAGGACVVGVDGGANTFYNASSAAVCLGRASGLWLPGGPIPTASFLGVWDEFAVAATSTPEPGTLLLTLTGLGLLGLLVVIRKRVALRHPQAT